MRALAAAATLLSATACYTSSELDADVGPIDAPRGACDPIGSMRACGPACGGPSEPCRDDTRVLSCYDELCVEVWERRRPGLALHYDCDLEDSPGDDISFTHRGDQACWFIASRSQGTAITESDCDALTAVRGERCRWSDGSTRTRTPPPVHTTCPEAPVPGSVLCGGPCGNCYADFIQDLDPYRLQCLGRNDDRDLGVCGLSPRLTVGCDPDNPASTQCPDAVRMGIDYPDAVCVCLSFRRETGFERAGWVVPRSNCTAYRRLYPGEVECYDDTWTALP